jgi:hypothetical protein
MIWGLVRVFGDFALESPHVVVAQVVVVAAAAAACNSSKTGFTSFKFNIMGSHAYAQQQRNTVQSIFKHRASALSAPGSY